MTELLEIDGITQTVEGRLAFGHHDAEFFSYDDGNVESALAFNEIRIIFDGPLRRSRFEEILCNDSTYSRFPDDTTPEEIAICGGTREEYANCTKVCQSPDGGTPIGIRDDDEDGVPDERRLVDFDPDPLSVELAVSITCDGVAIPLSQDESYWQAEGSQTLPQGPVGYRKLGPAFVLRPRKSLRTGSTCTVAFRDDVVDFHGDQVCASASGLPSEECTPGDTSNISFSTLPLFVTSTYPEDGETELALELSGVAVRFSAAVDPESQDFVLTAGGVAMPVTLDFDVEWHVGEMFPEEDFLPNTVYELTIGPGVRDVYGGEVVPTSYSWTTASK